MDEKRLGALRSTVGNLLVECRHNSLTDLRATRDVIIAACEGAMQPDQEGEELWLYFWWKDYVDASSDACVSRSRLRGMPERCNTEVSFRLPKPPKPMSERERVLIDAETYLQGARTDKSTTTPAYYLIRRMKAVLEKAPR